MIDSFCFCFSNQQTSLGVHLLKDLKGASENGYLGGYHVFGQSHRDKDQVHHLVTEDVTQWIMGMVHS